MPCKGGSDYLTTQGDFRQLGALIVRGGACQFVQHHALVEIGSGNLGQNVGSDVLAAREVFLDGALRDTEGFAGLSRVRAKRRLFALIAAAPLTDQPLPLKDFLAPDVVICPLRVRQFSAGELTRPGPAAG